MNDITRKRTQRVIERQVAYGSMIRLGDGQIIERDRLAQQTASQAVIMTSTTGHGAHLIAIWCDRYASRYSVSAAVHRQSPLPLWRADHSARPIARPGYSHYAAVSGRQQRRTSRRRTDAKAQQGAEAAEAQAEC